MVSSFLPFPLFSGGHIRLYNLIKELSRKHSITLISEKRDYQKEQEITEVKKFCKKVICVPRKKQWSLKNILKTGLSPLPFLIVGHISMEMKREIQKELNESQFDLIHVETSYVMQNIPQVNIPLVLVEHNVEYLVYKRFADSSVLLIRPLLYIDILKLKYWEEKMWRKATKLVAVSEIEKKVMEKKRKDVEIVRNGVDILKFKAKGERRKEKSGERRILFIGDFKWLQNRDAASWIIKEIWSLLNERLKMRNEKLILWIVGREIPESIKKMTDDPNIIFDENAPEDTREIYQKSYLLLAPIWVGGGTSYKILEALASGMPVVTTSLGNAIGAKENLEITIANTPQDFVKQIIRLFEDKEFYKDISTNARKLVEKKFSWEKIVGDLEEVYRIAVA